MGDKIDFDVLQYIIPKKNEQNYKSWEIPSYMPKGKFHNALVKNNIHVPKRPQPETSSAYEIPEHRVISTCRV